MPTIRPSADLRNKYNEISDFCHEYNEPVFITKNGKGDLVVMSMETYEVLSGKLELLSSLVTVMDQAKVDKIKPMKESINTINALEKAIKDQNFLEKYNLEKIGVFGSFARGENANDIDFYIDSDSYGLSDLKKLKEELEEITEKEVDILLKKYANPIILYNAKKDMKYVTQ